MQLSVHPGPISQSSEARFLLVPCPPNTSWQTFVGLESSLCDPAAWLVADNGPQAAWLFNAPADGQVELTYHFRDSAAHRPDTEALFAPVASPLSTPSNELAAKVSEITRNCRSEAESLAALIAFTASLFDYDHPERPFNHGLERIPLLSQLTKGNCADIHGFLLSCLYAAGVDAGYMAGFCFSGESLETRGYHCWLASRLDGEAAYWDVAQHVKADITPIRPGLDPLGGQRVAMSIGRGLVFTIDGQRIQLPHFGYPMWIYADGVASGLGATARILPGHSGPARGTSTQQQLIEENA